MEPGPSRSVANADNSKILRRCADSAARGRKRCLSLSRRFRFCRRGRLSRQQIVSSQHEADEAHTMNKIILADSQAIFRAGTAKVLAMDEDLRIIAQCTDLDRMHHAVTTFPGSIVLFATSLRPDLTRLRLLLEDAGSRGIVIAENNDAAGAYLQQGFRGGVRSEGGRV